MPYSIKGWLNYLSGISICLGIFSVWCYEIKFILRLYLVFVQLVVKKHRIFFLHSSILYTWFLNRSIWSIDGNLNSTTTPECPGSNYNEEVIRTAQKSGSGSLQSHVILCHIRTTLFAGERLISLLEMHTVYSKHFQHIDTWYKAE